MADGDRLRDILHNEDFIKSILEKAGSIPGMYEANKPQVEDNLVGTDKERKLMKILRTKHKNIVKMLALWKTYTILFEGVHTQEFIHRHLRESPQSVEERKKRGYYLNYVESITNIYSGFLFRQPIKRKIQTVEGIEDPDDEFNEIMREIVDDIDTNGTTMEDFMKTVAVWNMVVGNQYILVDSPKMSPDMTEEEQKEDRLYPFCVRIPPEDIMNWEFDKRGKLLWFRYREPLPPIEDPLSDELLEDKRIHKECYVTWTKEYWVRHEIILKRMKKKDTKSPVTKVEVKEIGREEHGLGEVPLVITKAREYSTSKFIGLSFIHDIAFVSIAIINVCSLLDEEMYQKALTLLAVKRSSTQKPEMEIGNNNVVEYTGDQPPFFISPSLTPGQFFLEIIATLSNEIFRMAKLSGGVAVLEQALSGIAHAYLFNETNQALSDQADVLEKAEKDIFRLITKWLEMDREDVEISISYPDDFGIIDVGRELQTLGQVKETIPSDTLISTLSQDVAQVLVQGKSQRDLQDIIKAEIEAGLAEAKRQQEEAIKDEESERKLRIQSGQFQGPPSNTAPKKPPKEVKPVKPPTEPKDNKVVKKSK